MNERAPNCRNTQTPSCSRSPITARTSWSRWSTLWRSRADWTTVLPPPLFLLLLPLLLLFTSFHRMPEHKLSHPHPHAQFKGQTHTGESECSQVKCTLGLAFGVWEWWAFLLPSPTTTFILSAPSESCLHSHKHGKEGTERRK